MNSSLNREWRTRRHLLTALIALALPAAALSGCGKEKKEAPVSEVAASAIVATQSASADESGGKAESTASDAAASEISAQSERASSAEGTSERERAEAPAPAGTSLAQEVSGTTGEETESAGIPDEASTVESMEESVSGLLFSLGGTIDSAEDPADPGNQGNGSGGAGGAILPGVGKIVIKPMEKNELTQYLGLSFSALEKKFPDASAEEAIGVRSYNLGEGVDGRTHQVGMTGSVRGGVITKINLYAGNTYKIAGIQYGMDLSAADKAARAAGFEPESGSKESSLTVFTAPDGLTVTVYSSDGVTVDTVICEEK